MKGIRWTVLPVSTSIRISQTTLKSTTNHVHRWDQMLPAASGCSRVLVPVES